MRPYLKVLFLLVFFLVAGAQRPAGATVSERRFALVVGNASYEAHRLATPANDAELIARTLQAAGFEVVHVRDLKQDALSQVFSEFLEMLRKAGPGSVALVYFAGYGLQLECENYLLPVDARIAVASDLPRYGLRLSDFMHRLAALQSKASIVIIDAARQTPSVLDAVPLAAGLAWLEPEANTLVAFNAAPGMFSADATQGYGPYARAVAEMINEAGFTVAETFLRVRLRVHELTRGAQVAWYSSNFDQQPVLVERSVDQLQHAHSLEREAWVRSQAMASLGPQEAYLAALIRDNFDAYADFLADHRRDPLGKRVLAMLAVRREAITWHRTCRADVREAYWTYLERYPNGAHGMDARRRLEKLGASIAAPAKFRRVEYDIPSPLPDELDYSGRRVPFLADAAFLPEPEAGLREIIGDPPEFAFRSAAAPSAANDFPVTIPVPMPGRPEALPRAGQRDSSLDFDTAQMRPSIDDHPIKADLPSARPSSVAAKAGLTSGPDDEGVVPAIPQVSGLAVPIKLPFWANLDPSRAATAIASADAVPDPAKLPGWASQEPIPSDRIMQTELEPSWTGALPHPAPALPIPTGLAHKGRRWVMLTPEGAIPLPPVRPLKLAHSLVPNRAMSSVFTSSVPQTRRQTAPSLALGGSAQPSQTTGRLAPLKPHSSNPASISRPTTARAGSPAGTSSGVTAGSQ